MKGLPRVFIIMALALTAMVFVQPDVKASADGKLLDWVNQARVDRGFRELTQGWKLSKASVRHSERMAETHRLFHTKVKCSYWAQDVGVGPSIWAVFKAFMASPAHKAAILGPWRRIGIGVVHVKEMFWVTLDFCRGAA